MEKIARKQFNRIVSMFLAVLMVFGNVPMDLHAQTIGAELEALTSEQGYDDNYLPIVEDYYDEYAETDYYQEADDESYEYESEYEPYGEDEEEYEEESEENEYEDNDKDNDDDYNYLNNEGGGGYDAITNTHLLSGVVTNQNGTPLQGASVLLVRNELIVFDTFTCTDGRFAIDLIQLDSYGVGGWYIEVSKQGFYTQANSLDTIADDAYLCDEGTYHSFMDFVMIELYGVRDIYTWYSISGLVTAGFAPYEGYDYHNYYSYGDADSNLPLENAMVSLFYREFLVDQVFTDYAGQYYFPATFFETGTFAGWSIIVEYMGFEAVEALLQDFDADYSRDNGVPHLYVDFELDALDGSLTFEAFGNIGDNAIISISQETIPPTAEYVDVRVYLSQTTIHGMGSSLWNVWYDSNVLSNPRLAERQFFDHSRLTTMQRRNYDYMRENNWPEEDIWEEFPHAIVTVGSHLGSLEMSYMLTGHIHGADTINMLFNPNPLHYAGLVYVYFRFDVAPGLPVGTVGNLEFRSSNQITGNLTGTLTNVPLSFSNGSVTIIQDTFDLEVSHAAAGTPTGMTVTAGGNVIAHDTATAVGVHRVVNGTTVILNAGQSTNQTFLGWMTHAQYLDLPTNAGGNRYVPGFPTTQVAHQIVMPNGDLHMRAVWGNQNGEVSRLNNAELQVSFAARNTPVGMTITAGATVIAANTTATISGTHPIMTGTSVTLNAGTTANQTFLGWMTHEQYLDLPTNASGNRHVPGFPVTGLIHMIDMPAGGSHMIAVWGNQNGEVSRYNNFRLNVSRVSRHEPVGMTITVGTGEDEVVIAANTAAALGNHNIMFGERVVLYAGAAPRQTFLGWMTPAELAVLPWNVDGNQFIPGFVDMPRPSTTHTISAMPSNEVSLIAVWGNQHGVVTQYNDYELTVSYVAHQTPTGMTMVAGTLNTNNTAATVGTHTIIVETSVILNAGTAANQTFLGWFTQEEYDAIPFVNGDPNNDRIVSPIPNQSERTRTIAMPAGGEHMRAVWGNQDGIVSRLNTAGLDVSYAARNTPTNMTVRAGGTEIAANTAATIDGPHTIIRGSEVILNAGTNPRQTFLGWYTPEGLAALPTRPNSTLQYVPGFVGPISHETTFDMPAEGKSLIAVWGNQNGVVSQLNASITFHAYGEGSFLGNAERVVYVTFDEALNMQPINDYIEYMDEQGALALWGWFTDFALDHQPRISDRTGNRRPLIGGTGNLGPFNVPTSFTEAEFFALADETGNFDLYAIWSLWGDINDDDDVCLMDFDIFARYVRGAYPSPAFVRAPGDVHRDGGLCLLDFDVLARYVRGAYPRPILGAWPATGLVDIANVGIATDVVATRFADSSILGAAGTVGDNAIISISQETIPPTAEYVDVRVYLSQTTIHGMGSSLWNVWYDSNVLSNPRLAERQFFDHSRLTTMQRNNYNYMRENNWSEEDIWAEFPHAIVTVGSHLGTLQMSYMLTGHVHGTDTINILFNPDPLHYAGHVYVYFRFDVAPGLPVGTVGNLEFRSTNQITGNLTGILVNVPTVLSNGSVTIIQDTFDLTVGYQTRSTTPVGMTVTAGTTVIAPNTATAVGDHPIVGGTSVTLNAGAVERQTFLGWFTPAGLAALPTNGDGDRYIPNFEHLPLPSATQTFDMPSAAHHQIAVWGNQRGIVSQYNDDALQVSFEARNEPVGMTITAGTTVIAANTTATISGTHDIMIDTSVTLYAGVAANQTFLGWMTPLQLASLPLNDANQRYIPNFASLPAPSTTHTLTMPAGGLHMVAVWGNQQGIVSQYNNHLLDVSYVARAPGPIGMTITVGTNVIAANTPATVTGTHNVMFSETVVLYAGTRARQTFLGWMTPAELAALPTRPSGTIQYVPNFETMPRPSTTHTIASMPNSNVTLIAVWGNNRGDVSQYNDAGLDVSYVARITPVGMTITVDSTVIAPNTSATVNNTHNVAIDAAVVLYAGTTPNQTFLGWMTQVEFNALPINSDGDRFIPGFTTEANRTNNRTMPDDGLEMVAVWGNNRGIVSRQNDVIVNADYSPDGSEVIVDVNLPSDEYDVTVDEGNNRIIVTIPDRDSDSVSVGRLPGPGWGSSIVQDGDDTIVTLIPPQGHEVEPGDDPDDPVRVFVIVTFNSGAHGTFAGGALTTTARVRRGTTLTATDHIPTVNANSSGRPHVGWTPSNPVGHRVLAAITFTAHYDDVQIVVDGRYRDDGEVEVTVNIPDDEYDVRVDDGNNTIVVTIPDADRDNVVVNPPSPDWSYTIRDDGQGGVEVVLIPPPDAGYQIERTPDGRIVIYITARFVVAGNGGTLTPGGTSHNVRVRRGTVLTDARIPTLTVHPGFTFLGWTSDRAGVTNPNGHRVLAVITFTANFNEPSGDGRGDFGGGGGPAPVPVQNVVSIQEVEYTGGVHERFIYGFPDGSVRPDAFITRAEAAMIFFRLFDDNNKHNPVAAGQFVDVDEDSWYSQAINYLGLVGVLVGYPDGTFRPNATITRAEFAAMATRFFGAGHVDAPNVFDDVSNDHWAIDYINTAASMGWIIGYEDGTFRPDNMITRGEAVTLINRAINRVPNEGTIRYHIGNLEVYNDITDSHWAYYNVMEASITHGYVRDAQGIETWTWFDVPSQM